MQIWLTILVSWPEPDRSHQADHARIGRRSPASPCRSRLRRLRTSPSARRFRRLPGRRRRGRRGSRRPRSAALSASSRATSADAVVLSMKIAPRSMAEQGAVGADRHRAQVVVIADASEDEVRARRQPRPAWRPSLPPCSAAHASALARGAVVDGDVVAALVLAGAPPSGIPSRRDPEMRPSPFVSILLLLASVSRRFVGCCKAALHVDEIGDCRDVVERRRPGKVSPAMRGRRRSRRCRDRRRRAARVLARSAPAHLDLGVSPRACSLRRGRGRRATDARQDLVQRRLALAAQFVHQRPATARDDRDLAGAGGAVAKRVGARLIDVEIVMGVLDGRDVDAARATNSATRRSVSVVLPEFFQPVMPKTRCVMSSPFRACAPPRQGRRAC